ncbi:MAG: HD domain-containing protein [Gemmatimonadetes bacterium]|nr:HD domain-containing protein [Gemmatimonadota bacterium]
MIEPTTPVRVADLMACLSVATDLGMGQPADYAMTSCVVAMRLGDALGFDTPTLQDVCYETLLCYVGCNADTGWFASLFGDEITLRTEYAPVDSADMPSVLEVLRRSIRRASAGMDAGSVEQATARAFEALPEVMTSFFPGHCEVARRLSTRMGFPESFVDTVGQIYARWDGKGVPSLAGEAIAPALLCASLAQDAVTFHRLGGVPAATAIARDRSGGAHAPHMVEVFCKRANTLLSGIQDAPRWTEVLDLEPGERRVLDDDGLDTALEAVADFSDIKSPWFLEHSRGVAALAERAGAIFGLPADDTRMLRRAALVHDIGKTGISAGTWGKAEPFSESEWEAVRLHPYYTGRVFTRSAPLAPIGATAALHHERLDGSGYYRNLPAAMLPAPSRVLAAANRFRTLVEARAHRPALSPERAARQRAPRSERSNSTKTRWRPF